MQILSVDAFPQLAPEDEAVKLNTAANDRLAGVFKTHPYRFAAFATLPRALPKEAIAFRNAERLPGIMA